MVALRSTVRAIVAEGEPSEAVVARGPGEGEGAEALVARIDALLGLAQPGVLVSPDGTRTEIPGSVLEGLRRVAAAIGSGRAVAIVPQGHQLTTQEAADMVHVSRPHLIKLLDRGDLPFHRTSEGQGSHRRLLLEDVLAYRRRRHLLRRQQLRELTEMSQDVEGGYR